MPTKHLHLPRSSGFGERLRALRLQSGLSQEELAARAGVGARTIGRMEQHAALSGHPSTRMLIADALGLDKATAAWLLGTPIMPTLPRSYLPILGREREMADALELFTSPAVRIISIVGPGGVGKTRLALEVAGAIETNRAWEVGFVELAPFARPTDVLPAIADALRVPSPERGENLVRVLGRAFTGGPSLLVLDNAEHLLAAAPGLVALIQNAPNLTLLVTSREALRIPGEQVLTISPLDTGGTGSAAVRLFLQQAQFANPGFTPTAEELAVIATICKRLDGLPLAIELAATHIDTLSPRSVNALLDKAGIIALSGEPTRSRTSLHASMNSAIAWSWDLLDAADQRALARLSVFAGGFDVPGLTALLAPDATSVGSEPEVAAARAIGALARKHLVTRLPMEAFDPEPRFTMLEPIRLFALDRLRASGEEHAVRRAHAEFIAGRYGELDRRIRENHMSDMDRIEQEYPNGRAAIDWAIGSGDPDLIGRMVSTLKYAHIFRYRAAGIVAQLDQLTATSASMSQQARFWLLYERAELASRENDLPRLRAILDEARSVGQATQDPLPVAMALLYQSCDLDEDAATAFATVSDARALLGDRDTEHPAFLQAWALIRRGVELHRLGRLIEARSSLEAGIAHKERDGNAVGNGPPLAHLGRLLQDLQQPRAAAAALLDALDIAANLRDDWLAFHAAHWLAGVARTGGPEAQSIARRIDGALAAEQANQHFSPGAFPGVSADAARLSADGLQLSVPLKEAIALAKDLPSLLPEQATAPSPVRFTGPRLE